MARSRLLFALSRLLLRWRGLRLLNLQIIHNGFHAGDGGGIAGCRSPLRVVIHITAKGHNTVCSLDADLPALNSSIAVNPGLNVGCDLGVGTIFFFRTSRQKSEA